jgi:APA family basic amino acid/polyamine antiporter
MPDMKTEFAHQPQLLRGLGLKEAVSVLMGSIIGSGIFLTPRAIAQAIQSPGIILLVWAVSGVLTLFGALAYAELGAMMPRSGGQYVYLREAFGPLWGFLFGWTFFLVIQTGSIAAVAVAFAEYSGYFVPLSPSLIKVVAILCILLLTGVNYVGVRFGGWVQNIFTVLKVGAIVTLVVLGFGLKGGSWANFQPLWGGINHEGLLRAFGVAMVAALWSYDGWNNVGFVAEEIKNPQRNLPIALAFGTLGVILIYLSANLVYMYILPVGQIAQSQLVAADVAKKLIGPMGAAAISAAVLVSTFGTVNGFILAGPRVYYAMARDGLFFKKIGEIHRVFRTPAFSIVVQGVWASLLTLTGKFEQLFTYVIFASWIYYAMLVSGAIVLRRKYPSAPRPYKTWGYPVVPTLFVTIALWFVYNTLTSDPRDSLTGLILVLLGLPAYWYWRRKSTRTGISSRCM